MLLLGSLFCLPAAAAGSLSASASAASVTVGSSVTVTLQYSGGGDGIGSIDASFHYNAAAFQYVSCSGASASGSAGELRISWYATDVQAPGSVSLSLTFKAIAAGSGDFSVSTSELINDNNVSLGTPSATVAVSAKQPHPVRQRQSGQPQALLRYADAAIQRQHHQLYDCRTLYHHQPLAECQGPPSAAPRCRWAAPTP